MDSGSHSIRNGALVGLAVSIALIAICVVLAGGGHGIYTTTIACFPYSMLLAIPLQSIATPLVLLALIQWPVYGAIVGWSRSRPKSWPVWLALVTLHIGVATIAFLVAANNLSFWP